jgi:hypothetical protein
MKCEENELLDITELQILKINKAFICDSIRPFTMKKQKAFKLGNSQIINTNVC